MEVAGRIGPDSGGDSPRRQRLQELYAGLRAGFVSRIDTLSVDLLAKPVDELTADDLEDMRLCVQIVHDLLITPRE